MDIDVKRLALLAIGTVVSGGGLYMGEMMGLIGTPFVAMFLGILITLVLVAGLWILFKKSNSISFPFGFDDDTPAGRVIKELKWRVEEAEEELVKAKVKELLNKEEE